MFRYPPQPTWDLTGTRYCSIQYSFRIHEVTLYDYESVRATKKVSEGFLHEYLSRDDQMTKLLFYPLLFNGRES